MPSSASAGKIASSGSRLAIEYSIWRSAIGWTFAARRDRLGPDLRQPDRSYVAGPHEIGDRADGVFDRHRRIQARRTIHVDVIGAEPDQRIREEVPHRRGARVDATPAAAGTVQHAELDRELDLVAAAGDRLADEQLVVARAIVVAGIEEGHAALHRGVNDGGALRVVGLAVGA